VNAEFDSNLVSSAYFQEALDWLAELLMSDLQTSREPVVKEMIRLTGIEGRGRSPNSPPGSRLSAEHIKPNRSRWAVNRKIALLLAASRETRIIRTIFIEAHLSDHILINMLPWAAPGNEMAIERILEIARMAAPRIRIRRGPKVTFASAAHELFLEKHGIRGASAYSYSDLEEDFIDEATQATRLEFPGARFGPQPASRRLKARRQLAGAWIPRRGERGASQRKSH
jgi:hypothetical protein